MSRVFSYFTEDRWTSSLSGFFVLGSWRTKVGKMHLWERKDVHFCFLIHQSWLALVRSNEFAKRRGHFICAQTTWKTQLKGEMFGHECFRPATSCTDEAPGCRVWEKGRSSHIGSIFPLLFTPEGQKKNVFGRRNSRQIRKSHAEFATHAEGRRIRLHAQLSASQKTPRTIEGCRKQAFDNEEGCSHLYLSFRFFTYSERSWILCMSKSEWSFSLSDTHKQSWLSCIRQELSAGANFMTSLLVHAWRIEFRSGDIRVYTR